MSTPGFQALLLTALMGVAATVLLDVWVVFAQRVFGWPSAGVATMLSESLTRRPICRSSVRWNWRRRLALLSCLVR